MQKIVNIVVSVLLTFSLVCNGITISKIVRQSRAADTELDVVRQQLETDRTTLERCRSTVNDITTELSKDRRSLQQTIEQLQFIKQKVQDMEDILFSDNGIDSDSCSISDSIKEKLE